jgi:phage shock protein C
MPLNGGATAQAQHPATEGVTMSLSDELSRLHELHARGGLTDDEYLRAKARLIDGSGGSVSDTPALAAINALRRSRSDRWVAGVCGGLARATGVESWVWRLVLTVLALFGGTGVVLYLLLWIFVPAE